jgi:uncharacterized protein YecE (DUF72 family)
MARGMSGKIRIGISGWRYAPWRNVFYPEALPHRLELSYAAARFHSIEINATFFALQKPQSFLNWYQATPEDFVFSLKGGRYITHMLKLKNPDRALANFFASGPLALGEKLGPVLWQLPPSLRFDPERLANFLCLLPHTTKEAARLARKHEKKMAKRCWTKAGPDRPLRHAMEIRNDSFCDPEFIRLLRRYNVGLVVADTVSWPLLMDVTADFVYCRLHGSRQLYASGYGPKSLERWARRIRTWSEGGEVDGSHAGPPARHRKSRDIYVYFDNDTKIRAPFDAQKLIGRLNLT